MSLEVLGLGRDQELSTTHGLERWMENAKAHQASLYNRFYTLS